MNKFNFDTSGVDIYRNNPAGELEGRWVSISGKEFLIRRAGGANKKYTMAVQRALSQRHIREAVRKGTLDPEESDKIMRDMYAKHIVIDWNNVNDSEGHPIPYSPEAFVAFMQTVPELFSYIQGCAQDYELFLEEEAEDAKNS